MANEKLSKAVKAEGYCCMWAFLEAHRQTYTSDLVALAKELGFPLTARAVRHQRRAYRRGEIKCENLSSCLKEKIRQGRKIP